MSDHGSMGTSFDDLTVDNTKIPKSTIDKDDCQTLKVETKVPVQANFGRPRKHPYKPGKYKCEYCDVMCSKPSVLKKHLRAHTNERPYPCSICKRSFKTKSNLSKHMKSKSHSSKIPSNKEKASLMLQALSGIDSEPFKANTRSMDTIEYDGIEKNGAIDNSPATSGDDRSVVSEDNSTEESLKRVAISDHSLDNNKEEAAENELSSCSGMLTINSERGPITVEVEIKLETMKQLQQGISNMVTKKCGVPPSASAILSLNDADVSAAESILHMSNQRLADPATAVSENRASPVNVEAKLGTPKDEHRRIDSIESPEYPTNTHLKEFPQAVSKPTKSSTLSYSSKTLGRSRAGRQSIPNEDQKKLKKCLMESLLKKMQKKFDRTTKSADPPSTSTANIPQYYNSISVPEVLSESIPSSFNPQSTNISLQKRSYGINSPSYKLNTLISDSKIPTYYPVNSSPTKSTMIIQRNVPTIPNVSNFQTPVQAGQAIYLLSNVQDSKPTTKRVNSPISSTCFSNCQRVFTQQVPSNVTTQTQPVVPNITTPPLHPVKEETIIYSRRESDSSSNTTSTNDSEIQSHVQHPSVSTTQESETDSSPRLCIVEDLTEMGDTRENKRSAESDEEIDVVNTDSDDNDSTMKRISGKCGILNKKRTRSRDVESDLTQSEAKKMKEIEKTLTLHAPNINAKDLVQDCPLNLSANRQPIIPSCSQSSQISCSVLENIYRPMVTCTNSSTSTITTTPECNLAALTNTNPAHPHSIRDPQPNADANLPSNGHHHHLDYPIFQDKVRCETCAQLIEPSRLQLHKSMHIFTDSKDQQSPSSHNNSHSNNNNKCGPESTLAKQTFNKPRTYRCVVCNTGFRVMGHLSKHHKSKSHLQGLVNSGLLSKALNTKIEESKVPIGEVIDQKTGNIIPDVLSRYLSDWSQPNTDSDST